MTLQPGSVVAGYTIERQIGAGGMGSVFLARHPTLPRSDALKVLSAEFSRDEQFRTRFIREADVAATLDHPNIVRVYTRGQTDDGQLWIAMQYVEGTDADAALRAGTMTPARAIHAITGVAKALDYAHSRNVLHRDVKPANFLLTGEPGPRERVLLADFGIARALDDATRLTATGSVMVTIAYASPESIEGRAVDYRSDLYSLGCSLYRLLTGRAPFATAGSTTEVMLAHVNTPPPRVTEVMPNLPPAIDAVVARAMAKDPAQRYGSARELAEAAAAAFGMTAPTGPTVSSPYTSGPAPTAGAPMSTPVPAYASNSGPTPAPPTSHSAEKKAKPKSGKRKWVIGAALLAVLALVAGGGIWYWNGRTPALAPYPSQSFTHAFGKTKLESRPNAVAAMTLEDADTVLSLGVQPVALVAPGGSVPSWLNPLIKGSPTVLANAEVKGLDPVKPDLIIDTSADESAFKALSEKAPTIAAPKARALQWTSTDEISWLAKVLGQQAAGEALISKLAVSTAKARRDHEFVGKSISVVTFSAAGLSVQLPNSPAAGYLSQLGFRYKLGGYQFDKIEDGTDATPDKTEMPIQESDTYGLESDVVLILRTDPAAKNGGFSGSASSLTRLSGIAVIVDQPEMVSALNSGGPAAISYLNTTLVDLLAKQIK